MQAAEVVSHPVQVPTPALPPGRREPALLQTLRYALRPYAAIEESTRRFGDCYTARALGQGTIIVFSAPDAVRDMHEIADRVIDGWPLGRPFPIHHEMQSITLDVILRAIFGVDEGLRLAHLRGRLGSFLALADSPAAAFLTLRPFQIELGGLTPWGRFVRRRATVRLMLLDEMFTLLVLPRPDVLARLREEIESGAGGGPVAPEHVPRLEYLDAAMKESARLTPVATNVFRRLHAPMRIGGVRPVLRVVTIAPSRGMPVVMQRRRENDTAGDSSRHPPP